MNLLDSMEDVRKDFPILQRKINGKNLIYLDSAATSQKPIQVIEALKNYYSNYNSNVHRAIYTLAEEATQAYEDARKKVADFIGAKAEEIIFVRNTTEAINLVANSLAFSKLHAGNEIISSIMEHHSNIVPWYLLSKRFGIKVKYVDIDEEGNLKYEQYKDLVNSETKLIAVTHASNMLGTINDIKEISKIAHSKDSLILVDGAQSAPHMPIDVKKIDCDFFAFSAHKMLGPTGIGILYAKQKLLEEMQPFLGGGEMIKEVKLDNIVWNDVPLKFEAGTTNIADAIAFGVAIDYLNKIGMENIRKHEIKLTKTALEKLQEINGLKIYGPLNAEKRCGLISFNLENIHAHDVAQILDSEGIAIRSGHHCTMPLHSRLGIVASARASFYIYNTQEEIDALINGLKKVKKILAV